jgi:hypothetical protein
MKKGFQYTLEDEKIIEYLKLTTKEKLQWLEEINNFSHAALDDQQKEIRARFRAEED